ncbi:MAG TPA: tetratricopeptide repeat protein, partial [Candidatus Eisenbacteria bacterium]|nr:tetratricopeptide repeat protein [Candidatus Eisenbacteria bacterium]
MAFLRGLVKWGHSRRYNDGILHFNRGEFERAAECFEAVLQAVPDPNDPDRCLARVHAAEARAHLGQAFFHAGEFARAEEQFTRALVENPTFPDLRYYRARIYERSGRLPEAVADLERALAEHPHYGEAHLLLAVCLGLQGDRERAGRELGEALQLGLEAPEWVTPAVAQAWTGEEWR